MSAWSKPSISRNTSVSAKLGRAPAILVAASALAATLGRPGERKWATTLRSSSVRSSTRTPWAMARAIRAMVRKLSPLAVLRSSARPMRVSVWARRAS